MTELKNNRAWLLKPLRLDSPDGAITEVFRAAPEDAYGRGIALTVTDGGEPMSLRDCTVYLAWSDPTGAWGTREFAPVDPVNGYFEVDFPPGMAKNGACDVRACIVIYATQGVVTTSREFVIHVRRPIVTDGMAEADESFSAFAQGVIDLKELEAEIRGAEEARAECEGARETAEAARMNAEVARADAEAARVQAETMRQDAFDDWLAIKGVVELNYVGDDDATAAVTALF